MDTKHRSKFLSNNSAQLTIVGLLLMFLVIVVMANLMGTIATTTLNMSANLTALGFATAGTLTTMIPMFLVVVLLATIAMYGGPQIR